MEKTAFTFPGQGRIAKNSGAPWADDPAGWDEFVSTSDPGSYLQRSPWAAVKAVNGWSARRALMKRGRGLGTRSTA